MLDDHDSVVKIGIEYNEYSHSVKLTNQTKDSLFEDVNDSNSTN